MRLESSVIDSLDHVPAMAWDALVPPDDPFTEHAYLLALETSQSVGPGSGWLPRHLLIHEAGGRLVGAAPCYLKDHSFGEYIFDWAFAEAALRAGIPYYPKLVCAVPFTPATGGRLLRHPEADARAVRAALHTALTSLASAEGASSTHVLFCSRDEREGLTRAGFLPRASSQYHLENVEGWTSFDDFLASLRAPSRKQIRRERKKAQGHGLMLSFRPASQIDAEGWEALWRCYQDTSARKWGRPYLRRAFFESLRTTLAPRVRLATAHDGERTVAAALFFEKGEALHGRIWGALQHLDCLHFELCYYLPIAYLLAHGLRRFEAGAQGEHKIRRGLMPRETFSAHAFAHPGLQDAVARFFAEEASAVREAMTSLARHGPFRRS